LTNGRIDSCVNRFTDWHKKAERREELTGLATQQTKKYAVQLQTRPGPVGRRLRTFLMPETQPRANTLSSKSNVRRNHTKAPWN